MSKKKAIELIKKEIEWCVNNPKAGMRTKEFKMGFIKGLKQAVFLLQNLTNN